MARSKTTIQFIPEVKGSEEEPPSESSVIMGKIELLLSLISAEVPAPLSEDQSYAGVYLPALREHERRVISDKLVELIKKL